MKNRLLIVLFIFSSFTAFSQNKLQEFTASGFKANFPQEPSIEKTDAETQLGKATITIYLSEGKDYMIMVSESKYPENFINLKDNSLYKGMLDGSVSASINNIAKQMESDYKSTLNEDFVYETKYTAKKYEGKIATTDLKGMSFIKGNQMYQIIILGNTKATAVDAFLKSFTVL